MKQKIPHSPFATHLSGSAKETELRLRSIFQWKKKRPPVTLLVLAAMVALFCGSLVSCQPQQGQSAQEDTGQKTVTLEDLSVEASTPDVQQAESELERTAETLPGKYDFNHDGKTETVDLVTVWDHDGNDLEVAWYELQVQAADGTILWTGEAWLQHPGWNSFFSCTLDGKDYLLQYNPTTYQGFSTYSYRVFSLGMEGEEVVFQEDSVSFDINFGGPLFESFDANAIADFADGINALLARSELLLSTDDALADIDPEAPRDDFGWLADGSYPGYKRDESKTLRENLLNLQRAVEQSKESGVPISELVIAEGETVLKNGANVKVKLVMREGSFLMTEETSYGGGYESGNYVGKCELQVWQGNTKITDYALEGEANGDMAYNFTGFPLEFDDYNNDGDPDFTVGQYGGSNAQMYSLFTLSEDAAIRMISAPYAIFSTDGKSNGYYSTLLTKTQNGFVVSIYNNAIGETVQVNYIWDETSGQFLQEKTNNSDAEN